VQSPPAPKPRGQLRWKYEAGVRIVNAIRDPFEKLHGAELLIKALIR